MGFFAYERVSTHRQDLDNQRVVLEKYAEAKRFTVKRFYGDVSGYPYAKRPQWDDMVGALKKGKAEGLLVFRVDRLGRTARDCSFFLEDLRSRGVALVSVHESFDTTTAMGRAMLEIILVLNQLEREQISEATKQRLAAAKAAGKRIGRPPISPYKRRRIRHLRAKGWGVNRIAKELGVGSGTVRKYTGAENTLADSVAVPA